MRDSTIPRTNGDLRASSAVVKDAEKFELTHHEARPASFYIERLTTCSGNRW